MMERDRQKDEPDRSEGAAEREPRGLSRRGFLGGLAAAGAIALVVRERPECPKLAGRPGTKWIGHC